MPRIKEKPYVTNLLEFQRAFPDEQACLKYLELVRWPDGFTCPKCGALEEPYYLSTRPRILVCRSCRAEMSLTAGTIMHRTKTPLQVWFWAAYLVTSQTPGMSALQFKRQLGLTRYETAFQILHKLRVAMVRPSRSKIGDGKDVDGNPIRYSVELDETYVGGRTRGKGRGVTEKVVVVGAVEVRFSEKEDLVDGEYKQRRYAGRLRLRLIQNRGKLALTKFATENIKTGTTVMTDDWVGYADLLKWFNHEVVMADGEAEGKTKAELQAEKGEQIPLIHLVFSNLKTWIQGTHHGVSPKHLQAYLNEYVFRFNRRFYPMSGFHSVLGIAMEVEGMEYEDLYDKVWECPSPKEQGDSDSD
jgi:hypothetical protein